MIAETEANPGLRRMKRIGDMRSVQLGLWLILIVEGAIAVWLSRPWVFGDNAYYLTLSDSLAHGRYGASGLAGFEADTIRPPGYPALLALVRHGLGFSIVEIVILQLGAYLLSIFLLTRILKRRGGGAQVLLLLAICYPAAIMYGTQIAAEAWTEIALASLVFLLETTRLRPAILIVAGLICGVAAYLRSDLLPVAMFLAAYIFIRELRSKTPPLRSAVLAALPVVAAAFILLPYAMWNEAQFRWPLPVPVAGAVGTSLYLSTWQEELSNDDVGALYRGAVTPRAEALGLGAEVRSINKRLGADPLMAPWVPGNYPTNAERIAVTHLTKDLAFKRIAAEPWGYAAHVMKNSWRLWQGGSFPPRVPRLAALLLQLASWLIFIVGFAGVLLSFIGPRDWPLSAAPAVILLSVPLVHVWLHTEARYTAPVRPILLLLAAATVIWLVNIYLSRKAGTADTEPNISRSLQS